MPQRATIGGPAELWWDDFGVRASSLRVDLSAATPVTIRAFTLPVVAGDALIITGEVNLTTHVGRDATGAVTGERYPVGVATGLWLYDAPGPDHVMRAGTWRRLGVNGENVTPAGHHIQQGLTRPWVVPAGWDPTVRLGVALRVDVHSTAWAANDVPDQVLVESHGVLMCARYSGGA